MLLPLALLQCLLYDLQEPGIHVCAVEVQRGLEAQPIRGEQVIKQVQELQPAAHAGQGCQLFDLHNQRVKTTLVTDVVKGQPTTLSMEGNSNLPWPAAPH